MKPVIYCVSNYVTLNDVAQMAANCQMSPIMGMCLDEVEILVEKSDCLYINSGTLTKGREQLIESALRWGSQYNRTMILDPVGCGISHYRLNFVQRLIKTYPITVIKCNGSELEALATGQINQRSTESISHKEESYEGWISSLGSCPVASWMITGANDWFFSPSNKAKDSGYRKLSHDKTLLPDVVGSGCMYGVLVSKIALDLGIEGLSLAHDIYHQCARIASELDDSFYIGPNDFKSRLLDAHYNYFNHRYERELSRWQIN